MEQILDIEQLKEILPHREPMLLIEEAITDDNGACKAKYKIKENEYFTRGHFPNNPIVPGVILCEIMAQSCATTVQDEMKGHLALYAGIDKVRFKRMVKPGDLCEIECKLKYKKNIMGRKMFFCSAKLCVEGQICCTGELSFALVPKE